MKKNVILLAMAALAVSCTNEEIVEPKAQMAIGFNAATSQPMLSRSTLTDGESLKKNGPFEVYAFNAKDGKLFMGRQLKQNLKDYGFSEGVDIVYNDNAWNYQKPEERAYWPVDPLNFYAFHPKSDPSMGYTIEVQSDQTQQLTYAVPTTQQGEKDILYAVAKNVTKDTHDGKVKLNFKHALSLVTFKAKTELASMTVDIEDWKIHVISSSGTMTLPTDEHDKPVWAPGRKTLIDNQDTNFMTEAVKNIGTESKLLGSKLYIPQTMKPWDTNKTINEVDALAQKNADDAKWDAEAENAKETYLSVVCKIRQNGNLLWGSDKKYLRLYVPFGATWEPGKRYIYTLVFGGGYSDKGTPILKPLEIEADVSDMEDAPQDVDADMGLGLRQ